jgi:hypothetical protein
MLFNAGARDFDFGEGLELLAIGLCFLILFLGSDFAGLVIGRISLALETGGVSLREFSLFPTGRLIERFHGPRPVKVQKCIELIR